MYQDLTSGPGAARVLAALRAAPQSGATITPF